MDSLASGVAEFDRDWPAAAPPSLRLGAGSGGISAVEPAPAIAAAAASRYFLSGDQLTFALPLGHGSDVDPARDRVYVAGDFNGWQQAVGAEDWELRPAEISGERVLCWTGPAERVRWPAEQRFKFVTGEHQWLSVPVEAPNAVPDGLGNRNRLLDPARTGRHLWSFALSVPLDLADRRTVACGPDSVPLGMGAFFYKLGTDLPLGALTAPDDTTFRLFAPRARGVTLCLAPAPGPPETAHRFALDRREGFASSGVWEVVLDENLHGWYYWYLVDGVRDGPGRFDPAARVLDPYARAAVDRDGPGIVIDPDWF